MSDKLSARFSKVFNDLPPEAQQTLLKKSLGDVLDQLPPDVAKKVYSSALQVQTKHQNVPKLDLRGKRKEVNALLDLLTREVKMPAMFSDRSRREEIVSEIVQSLTSWLNDVWSTFYEHRVQYVQAHACLLFVTEVVGQLDTTPTPGGCKCELMNLPIRFAIKDKNGVCVTKLRVRGPMNIDRLLLWIWRDLAVCLLAKDDKKRVKDIIADLESIYGFPVLERLLLGGRKSPNDEAADEDDDIFLEDETYSDMEDDDPADFLLGLIRNDFHSVHWKGKFVKESNTLRNLVEDFLFEIFTVSPNLALYDVIIDITLNEASAKLRASGILYDVAGNSSDNLVGALSIESAKNNASRILSLLDQYSYLLRPRDSVILQCAAGVLGDSMYHARGLSLLETGLEETLVAIQVAVRGAFTHIDESLHKRELTEILKLRVGHPDRRDRIESWTQAISSSSAAGLGGPMAFAAMMFGIPMMPGMPIPGLADNADDTADFLNFIDLESGGDSDLEDLREDFRPKLKQRFEGWTQLATVMKGGVATAAKVYTKVAELMPYMRGTDVVTEMVNRLADRPGKGHICDALEAVSSFCKTQRKKLQQAKKEKDKQAAAKAAKAAKANAAASSSATPAAASAPGAGPSIAPRRTPRSVTVEDVDDEDDDDDDGPPPLIPAGISSAPPPAPVAAASPPTATSTPFFSFSLPFPFGSGLGSGADAEGSGSAGGPSTSSTQSSPPPASSTSVPPPTSTPAPAQPPQSYRLFEGMEDVD